MATKEERRAATLKRIHEPRWACVDLADMVVQMAIRYGTAKALMADMNLDYELAERARNRRFGALLRLVTALKRQS